MRTRKWLDLLRALLSDLFDRGAAVRELSWEPKEALATLLLLLSATVTVIGQVDALVDRFMGTAPQFVIALVLVFNFVAIWIAIAFIRAKTRSSTSKLLLASPEREVYTYNQVQRQFAKVLLIATIVGLPVVVMSSLFWYLPLPDRFSGVVVENGTLLPVSGAKIMIRSVSGSERTSGSDWITDDHGVWYLRATSPLERTDHLVVVPQVGTPLSVPLNRFRNELMTGASITLVIMP